MAPDVKVFLHCKTCNKALNPEKLVVGLTSPTTMVIDCDYCNQRVGEFELTTPIPLRCDQCGEVVGPNHIH